MTVTAGFLDEAPGERSMARLAVLLMVIAEVLLIVALAVYLLAAHWLTGAAPDAGVIAAVGVPITGLAGGIWAALRERTTGAANANP